MADKIENGLDFVNYQKPVSTDVYVEPLGDILDMTMACFSELSGALRAFFKPKGQMEDLRL